MDDRETSSRQASNIAVMVGSEETIWGSKLTSSFVDDQRRQVKT